MPSVELGAGSLRVEYPESYSVKGYAAVPPSRVTRGRNNAGPTDAPGEPARSPSPRGTTSLLALFEEHHLDVVEQLELVPAGPTGAAAGHGSRSAPGTVRLTLDLPEDHGAVVLLEQDGVLAWQLPARPHSTPPQGMRPVSRVVRFEIRVHAVQLPEISPPGISPPGISPPGISPPGDARGLFGGSVTGRVTAYVLRFASRFVPGAVLTFLERHTHRGLVLVTGDDIDDWKRVDSLKEVELPDDRPAKILLLVHGTFSDTTGSFGMISSTTEGQRLLTSVAGAYDAVIGFDHRTLSRDPLENAIDLQGRLDARHLGFTPAVDVISYSRGALVARSLIEYLLPSASVPLNIGTVIFVGGTNAGTKLADPENWEHLLDLYTNLAMATARSLERMKGTATADQILRGLLTGIGPLVKYLSLVPAANRLVPGLIAMDPDGPFITGINGTQHGQPVAGTPWYVVSSDFEIGPADVPDRDPSDELALRLADGLADTLMGATNDLVVETASMESVDLPSGGGFIKDALRLGTNPVVHHLNYFIQPKVCAALRTWLS